MLKKISGDNLIGHGPIKVLYPGLALSETDTGFGSIGRIDHALFHGDNIIRMHPHVNDEILTYFRTGYAEHIDSEGITANITNRHLMLMKAGRSFFHEENIIDKGEPLEGLQIFIRPREKDMTPTVTFLELENDKSEDEWRLIASPLKDAILQFSSQTWIYDRSVTGQQSFGLPQPTGGLSCLLYVFNGSLTINGAIPLAKKDSLFIKGESITINAEPNTELVLFAIDESGEHYDYGMYSGNQK